MLVLTRKKEETLHIGDDVTVTILKIKGNTVQIGVEAPRSVRVLRGELADRDAQGDRPPPPRRDTPRPPAAPRTNSSSRRATQQNRLQELASRLKRKSTPPEAAILQLV